MQPQAWGTRWAGGGGSLTPEDAAPMDRTMSFVARIRRTPLPYDADAGNEGADHVPGQPPEVREVLVGAAGGSPFLKGLMARDGDWLTEALTREPQQVRADLMADADAQPDGDLMVGLRRLKRRLALYTALADLAGVWSLAEVTAALTDFADRSTDRAMKAALAPQLARGRVPGHGENNREDAAGMVALAMGKMGAHELNFSSDIDLVLLFDDARFEGSDIAAARSVFVRAARTMTKTLSEMTGDGYVWRTDLRLRPDPAVTPVVVAMDAAERYYESLGRTWERAAHIKARPAAGDLDAGRRYIERLRPFVWRRHLDFAAIEDAHDMRRRIRDHRGLHDEATLEGRDLKLAPGGIREIEFFTQTRQLIAGGRDPALRVRGTVEGLARLAAAGWIPKALADMLTEHYGRLREIEHRLQMVADARTHALPTSADGFDRIARLCGEGDTGRFRAELSERLAAVRAATEGFFARTEGRSAAQTGPQTPEPEIVARWRHYPALRSGRAQAIFERLKPDLIARLQAADRPDEAFAAFDGFLSGLPAGVQLFALFEANPQLRALIVDIAATAPALARYLSRHAGVLDAVCSGRFFEPWPGRAVLERELADLLSAAPDYEEKLSVARRWAHEWHFRIGVHHLRGLAPADEVGVQYADLAAATLGALLPVVTAEFAAKHGVPPGRGLALFAMGSLGAGWINSASDLDLIAIYDPAGVETSDGPRPLASRPYYARLTQAVVTALSAPMADGKLYEVDMRLRPSGRQGPVATSLASFAAYQRDEAWTWEHMALTRARILAGARKVAAEAEAIRAEVLQVAAGQRAQERVWADLAEMRGRLFEAKPASGPLDTKPGPGGLTDIELFGQALALSTGASARRTAAQLQAGAAAGLVPAEAATRLAESYRFARGTLLAGRLVIDGQLSEASLGRGATDFLLRQTEAGTLGALMQDLAARRAEASEMIDAALARS
ncbi:MAG: glutamine-synthetase adenylyltransferase [Pseudomonadota bacterium]